MEIYENEKTKYIRIAAIIALTGNAILAVLKIIVGFISKSGARYVAQRIWRDNALEFYRIE